MKWTCLTLLILASWNVTAITQNGNGSSECEVSLNPNQSYLAQFLKAANKDIKKGQQTVNIKQARFNMAEYILKKGKLPDILKTPSLISRAASFKLRFASLSPDEQQKVRQELIRSALQNYKGAREALIEKLSATLIKQFSQDYTLPSFSHLAATVDSSALELTRFLYEEGISSEGVEATTKNGYKLLIAEIEKRHADDFEKVKSFFINVYALKARESGRTLNLKQFYNAITLRKPGIENHFTLNHIAYLLGEELPIKSLRIQKPYIRLFDSLENLYRQASQLKPASFDKVLDKYQINAESQQVIVENLQSRKRVIFTAAAPGVEIHEEAFSALVKFAEEKDAFIVVFAEAGQPMRLDPLLVNHPLVHIIHDNIEISPWLKANTLPLHFKRQDPNSPLRLPGRGGHRGQIHIIGHPQLREEYVPTNDNHIFPHRILTTGAITKAWYAAKRPIGGVTDDQARDVHVIGALLLEKDSAESGWDGLGTPNTWHPRHIEWSEHSKSFIDNGFRYTFRKELELTRFKPVPKNENLKRQQTLGIDEKLDDVGKHQSLFETYSQSELRKISIQPEYMVFGDEHIGGEDHYSFFQEKREAIKKFKPKRIVLHDLFDGKSINHWESQNMLIMAKKAANNELNLKVELDKVVAYVNQLLLLDDELTVIIVESNHNNWLTRLLKEADKLSQPINDPLVYELIHAALNMDIDPLEYYLTKRSEKILSDPDRKFRESHLTSLIDESRVQFLPKGTSLKVGPADFSIEIGEHGHNGGGFRGAGITLRSTAGRSYTGIVYGHTHSPGRFNRSGNAGASISPRQDYAMAGASATGMAFINVYDDGTFQVHTYDPHSQTYELGEGQYPLPAKEFFFVTEYQSWPRVIEHEEKEKNIDTLDQWRGVSVEDMVNQRYRDN